MKDEIDPRGLWFLFADETILMSYDEAILEKKSFGDLRVIVDKKGWRRGG